MEKTLAIMKALADRNRLRISLVLNNYDELCACQITELLGVSGATVSKHLAVLQKAGLLTSRKSGKWVFYRLCPDQPSEGLIGWLKERLHSSKQRENDMERLAAITAIDPEEICRKQRGVTCCPPSTSKDKTL